MMFHITLCLPNIRGSRIEIQFKELWCLQTVFPQQWKKTGMLFLDLGQKKLILVVIQEKSKKSMYVFIYYMSWGRGVTKIRVKIGSKWFCFIPWKDPEVYLKALFWCSSDKENRVHLLQLLRSRRNLTRRDGRFKRQGNQPQSSHLPSLEAEGTKVPQQQLEPARIPGIISFPIK